MGQYVGLTAGSPMNPLVPEKEWNLYAFVEAKILQIKCEISENSKISLAPRSLSNAQWAKITF